MTTDKNRVIIFDTTLRDGEQSPGCSMTLSEKLRVAEALEHLGVDVIEAGFAIASNGDFESVSQVAGLLKETSVCSLARASRKDIDRAAEALKKAVRPRIHTFISTSPLHMQYKLQMTPEEVIEHIVDSVTYARNLCDDVEWSCEDGTRTEEDFLYRTIEVAIKAGATTINVPDTVGYTTPGEYRLIMENIIRNVPNSDKAIFSTHCHNDLGLAVSNSIAAVQGGARQIECTVNGIGERAGNAALEEIIMAFRTRQDVMPYHTGIIANCASCHNGNTATGKPNNHFVTSLGCETCHRNSRWSTLIFRHSSARYPDHGSRIDCTDCHRTNAQQVPYPSQAYAPELVDGDQCYAHQLQLLLSEQDPGHKYTVANWSIGGASSPEMLLLASRAVDHDPDLLMIATHSRPFISSRAKMNLSSLISDSSQLAYDRSIRDRLPGWFQRQQGRYSPDLFLESHSGLVRLRDIFVELREKRWVPRQLNPSHLTTPKRSLPRAPKIQGSGKLIFSALIHTFHDDRPNTPLLVISMPLCQSKWDPKTWQNLHDFGSLMKELLVKGFPDDPTITTIDAVDVIDESLFLTQAHMKPQGHVEFSQYLLPYVQASLNGGPKR